MGLFKASHRVVLDHPDGTRTVWEGSALTGWGAVRQADKKAKRAREASDAGKRAKRGRS